MLSDSRRRPLAIEDAAADGILTQLRRALDRAAALARELERVEPAPEPAESSAELGRRLAAAEADLEELAARLVETENQRSRLMNLYVATYQLHATLEMGDVAATVAEIARDLLGAESFVLLLRDDSTGELRVALECELAGSAAALFTDGLYRGGDEAIDLTLTDGVIRTDCSAASDALAVVPLTVQGSVVGALVVIRLFAHKEGFSPGDRDLLDLLAAHAASALFAARLYATTDRKLKTLESLVKLVR